MTQNNYEALQNLKAKVPHEADDVTGVGGDESVSEALSKNVLLIICAYLCSAIALPATSYPLWDSIPANVVDSGKLSQLQLEGVLYACTKHQQFLPGGNRKYACLLRPSIIMMVTCTVSFTHAHNKRQ